jgi:hypothetical protein
MDMNANGKDPGVTRDVLLGSTAMRSDAAKATPLASELIWEVEGIAAELGLPTRVAYNLLRTRALPGQKVGGKWCSSRSALRDCFKQIIAGEVA